MHDIKSIEEVLQTAIKDHQIKVANLDIYVKSGMAIPLHVLKELDVVNNCAKVAYYIQRRIRNTQENDLSGIKTILENQRKSAMEKDSDKSVIALYDDLLCHFDG
jgi:hypothetical protein